MRTKLRPLAVALGLLFPALVLAAPPSPVLGLRAQVTAGQVRVQWEAAEGASGYRVYMGRQSIIQTGGQYDDFETVGEGLTDFILQNPPASGELFLAVLAVNDAEEESDFFLEEVRVDLSAGDGEGVPLPASAPLLSPSSRERQANTLGLVSAEATSPSEVLLTFNNTVTLRAQDGQNAFEIVDEKGKTLPLHRLAVDGATVRITTGTQAKETLYRVTASPVVMGTSPAGTVIPLDESRASLAFAATSLFPAAVFSSSSVSSVAATPPAAAQATGIRNLRLSYAPDGRGFWKVNVEWDADASVDASGFVVRAEREGREATVPSAESGMSFTGVSGGTFTASVRAITANGLGDAARASIVLGGRSAPLTRTGPGTAFLLGISAGAAGWLRRKRQAGSSAEQNRILG